MVTDQHRSFAVLLDELCAAPPAGRHRPYSNVELAEAVGVSHSYIAQLRKGIRDNPNLRVIDGLASALQVHPAYFVGGRRNPASSAQPRRPFRDKLNRLFALVHPAGQGELTLNFVVGAVRRRGQELGDRHWTISPSTLSGLRDGSIADPELKHLLALADVFGADPAYFLDDQLAAQVEEQLETRLAMASLGVDTVIMRASEQELEPRIRDKIITTLTQALKDGRAPTPETQDELGSATRNRATGHSRSSADDDADR
ncbi:helix-turn-helix domain-containing protein [Amycolatopsis sp. NPDC059021]|uniref:helix-turn-helix domain-containing protein n=1 Tax=Amycolatopsis sp. NPDC059021 TaxID=3346704 RepID=UPI00366FE19D